MAPANPHDRHNRRMASGVRAPGVAIGFALRLFVALAAWIAAATAASAQPPVNSIDSCQPIVKSGYYEVDQALTPPAPGDCIVIKAPNVVLNLNSAQFAITGLGQGVGIHVTRMAANVFIEGEAATISHFIEGIEIDAANATAENFTASNNGDDGVYLNGAKQAKISNFTTDGNFNDGVRIFKGTLNILQNFTSQDNSRYGVWIEASSHNTIGGGYISNNPKTIAGIYLGCWGVGPRGQPCKPALAPSDYNSIFDGSAYGANGSPQSYGVAIDLGDNFNKVANMLSEGNSTFDMIDENTECASNLWISVEPGTSSPPFPGCIP